MKNIILLLLLSIILLSLMFPVMVYSREITLGGNLLGTITGVEDLPPLPQLSNSVIVAKMISLSYIENGEDKRTLIDLGTGDRYTYTVSLESFFTLIGYGDYIVEIIGSRGGLLQPTPRTYVALMNRENQFVKGWVIQPANPSQLLDAYMDNSLRVLLKDGDSILFLKITNTSLSSMNITNLPFYNNVLVYRDNIYIYLDNGSTIIFNTDTSTAKTINGYMYPSNDANTEILWRNNQLVVKGNKTYVIDNVPEPLKLYGYKYMDKYVIGLIDRDGGSSILVLDTEGNKLYRYSIDTNYISAGNIYPYKAYRINCVDNTLYIVYGVSGETAANMLLISSIDVEKLATKHEEVYMNSLDYPSKQVKSVVKIELSSEEDIQPTTYTITSTGSSVEGVTLTPDTSSEYRDLTIDKVGLATAPLKSTIVYVKAPDETMKYTDFELTGLTYSVTCKYPTGVGVSNVDVELTAKIYIDNNYLKTIDKAIKTDRQGMARLSITKDEINATGDIRVEWILRIDGYTVNGTTTIPYPFPRTTTTTAGNTTTTTIPPPPTGPTGTTTTTTTTSGGAGKTTTTTAGEAETITTQPQGGGLNLLIIVLIIIIVVAIAAGFIMLRRR